MKLGDDMNKRRLGYNPAHRFDDTERNLRKPSGFG